MCKFFKQVALGVSHVVLFSQVHISRDLNSEPRSPIATIPAVQALIALAKEKNPDIQVAYHRTMAESARIEPAGALPDPQLSLGIQKGPNKNIRIADTSGLDSYGVSNLSGILPSMTEYSMSVGQAIPWPGKLGAKENIARQNLERSGIGIYEAELLLESSILSSCLELLVLQARRELLVSQQKHWAATEEIIKARLDQGGSSTSEAIQAMQEQSRLKLRLLELDVQIEDQKELINQLVVRQPDTFFELDVSLLKLELPEPPEVAELAEELKAYNPEWLASLADIKIATASVHSAKMDRLPDFWTGIGFSKAGTMPVGWRAEFGIALPIWNGRKQNKVVERTLADRRSAEAVQASLDLVIATKSRERARAWKLADKTKKMYENELIPQGEATLEILMARFQNGGASFGSMLETLNSLLKDQENRLEAIASIHRIAILQHGAVLSAVSKVAPSQFAN